MPDFEDDGVVLLGPRDVDEAPASRLRPVAALTTGDKFQLLANTVQLLGASVAAVHSAEAKKTVTEELVASAKLLADFVRSAVIEDE